MSGVYGTVRAAQIDLAKDVEILYYYRPTRSTTDGDFTNFKQLDASCLVPMSEESSGGDVMPILGMYNLRLPVDKFNMKGFYTIYIRPKERIVTLSDVSVLAAYPNVKGLVFDANSLDGLTDLSGYRVEYFESETSNNRSDIVRIITSCNRCEPTNVSISDAYVSPVRYRLTDSSSNFVFCTITPSVAPSFRANAAPYIGSAGERVVLINTKFNPIMLELEMVEHDEETISYMLEGDQVRDRDNAIITTYTDDNEIYHQHDYYTIKSKLGTPLYDVKAKRTNIDGSQSYDNVINGTTE
jgi:hypothetical protein